MEASWQALAHNPWTGRKNSKFHCLFSQVQRKIQEMPPKSVRWGTRHNKALQALFVGKKADPERAENDYIDRFWDNAEPGSVFLQVTQERFRYHFKEKASQWLTEQAVAGLRRRESPPFSAFTSFCQLTLF
jgi:hypothetical protein